VQLRTLLENQNFVRIPLKSLATGHYKLVAKINGKKGDFILDTGASTSCIGFESSHAFLLHSEESDIKAAGAGAIDMETRITHNNTLEIGKKRIKNTSFVLFDLQHVNAALKQTKEASIDGIIGADILKSCRATIDYGRNCLYLK